MGESLEEDLPKGAWARFSAVNINQRVKKKPLRFLAPLMADPRLTDARSAEVPELEVAQLFCRRGQLIPESRVSDVDQLPCSLAHTLAI